ncbi:hypothetical protein F183_A44670 [Bryobacterales bacterium F-183]|nr:hypothetical protein F183_A44670 [Bryobacterales bacterium F-183]
MSTSTPYDQLRDELWPKGIRPDIWAILDGARSPKAYRYAMSSGMQRECLFAGALPPALEQAAPYLVQLDLDDTMSRRIINEGFGESWGIFLKADLSIRTVRRHLRTILRVHDPKGRYALFRYWDPRVLRAYLPTCMPNELKDFFGPIEAFWAEDDIFEERVFRFERQSAKLIQTTIPVVTPTSV